MAGETEKPTFETPAHERNWIDDPANVTKIVYALVAACVALVVIDPFVHKHGYFPIEHFPGFYAVCGLVACVLMVLVSKALRVVVKRSEDYYDD